MAVSELTTSFWGLFWGAPKVPGLRGVNGGAAGFMAGGLTDMGVELTDVPYLHALAYDVAFGNTYICVQIFIALQSD